MAVLGLLFCARAPSSCSKRGPLFIAVRRPLIIAARRPLIIAASLVAEHRLQTRRLSSCGSRAQLLRGMWDLPRPGPEPASPALAGRFSTTAPPGKPQHCVLKLAPFNNIKLPLSKAKGHWKHLQWGLPQVRQAIVAFYWEGRELYLEKCFQKFISGSDIPKGWWSPRSVPFTYRLHF